MFHLQGSRYVWLQHGLILSHMLALVVAECDALNRRLVQADSRLPGEVSVSLYMQIHNDIIRYQWESKGATPWTHFCTPSITHHAVLC